MTNSHQPRDAEAELRRAHRPLVLGMGGGGDVVGALATAEFARIYDGAAPVLGGLTWERLPVDPLPGPRAAAEIAGATELAPGILRAGPDTRIAASGIAFGESKVAELLGHDTVLVDINLGPHEIADGLRQAVARLQCDLVVMIDVGGDVLAHGTEPGLRSPLCDAVMLAAAAHLARLGTPVLVGVFGAGCDGELTFAEVLARLAEVAAAGGWCGTRGLTDAVAERIERAAQTVHTEASVLPAQAFRGVSGATSIRAGRATVELSAAAALTFYIDPQVAVASTARLARAVADADTLDQANEALHALGVDTELDRELARAGATPPDPR